jgi:hypothetical protein
MQSPPVRAELSAFWIVSHGWVWVPGFESLPLVET